MIPLLNFKLHHNSKFSAEDILQVLAYAGYTQDFAENSSNVLNFEKKQYPDADSVLRHIKKYSREELEEIFDKINEELFLVSRWRRHFSKPVDLAIDFTDKMYYGDKDDEMVVGTQPKAGTSYAYKYATITIVEPGIRYVLKSIPVGPDDKGRDFVGELIEYASKIVKIRNVYLDRGFFSVDYLNSMKKSKTNYLMPVPKRPPIKRLIEAHGAPWIGWYKVQTANKKKEAWVKLILVKNNYKDKKEEVKVFTSNIELEDLQEYFQLYSKRWGIETSYRVENIFRPKTTSKNYVIRLFYFLFSVCMYNLWIFLNTLVYPLKELQEGPQITAKLFVHVLKLSLIKAYDIDY